MGQLRQPQVAMATDGQGVTGPLDTLDRSSYRRHRRTGESERLDLDDRLVADLHCLQSGRDIRGSTGLARRQGGREPAEPAGLGNPSLDRTRPRTHVADRIGTGQAHLSHDAIGDCGSVVGGEDDRLVAAGRELGQ